MMRIVIAVLPFLATVAAAAEEEPSSHASEVARAQTAEDDARRSAEGAMEALRDYVKATHSLAHNESAIAAMAHAVEAQVTKDFRDRRDQIRSRLHEIHSSIRDIRDKANQTADDEAHVEALQREAQALDAEQEKLDVDHEIREMFHAAHDAEVDENRKVKALEEDGKHAAKEWKHAARRTEDAKEAAGFSERVYEGEYQDTEALSERMHDRFQDEADEAQDGIEDVYESVLRVLDHRADALRDGRASEAKDAEAQPTALFLVDSQVVAGAAGGSSAADEDKASQDPVAQAEADEVAAKEAAEEAYAKIEQREADLRATSHDDSALDGLAQQVRDHVHPQYAALEDGLLRQMEEDRETRDGLLSNPNRTAEDLHQAAALDADLHQRREALHDVRERERRDMHAYSKEREVAEKQSARELRGTAKDAATEWKHAARHTEHVRKEADMSERFYEGAFQKAESSSEKLHDRAENVGDDAANWVEKIYDAVWKRLDHDYREAERADDAAAPKADFPAPSPAADAAQHGKQGSGAADSQPAATQQQAHSWATAVASMSDLSSSNSYGTLGALACLSGLTVALFMVNLLGHVQLRLRSAARGASSAVQRSLQPLLADGGASPTLAEESA